MPIDPGEKAELHAALLKRLDAAYHGHADPRAGRLLENLIEDAIGLVADGSEVADLKLVTAAFAEIRAALAVFRPYPGKRKVTAFGSARIPPDHPAYAMAVEFGRKLAQAGFMVITGGGPGIMGAVLEGAGRDNSFGVGIRLPFEQIPHATLRGDPKLIEFKYFFTRKLFFVKEASGVALLPGGFGTHDEGFETLTLVQTGKSRPMPIVCLDVPGGTYWTDWNRYVHEHLLEHGLISEPDLALYRLTQDVDEAVEEITRFYSVYHSMRTIRRRTVFRLNRPLSSDALGTLAREFADILGPAPIRPAEPYKEELDEPSSAGLPRIVFDFDLHGWGRLRQMINRINELGSAEAAADHHA